MQRFLQTGRLLLADDMGLGKTTQGIIACCHALFTARRVKRGVLLGPAALKSQWMREWEDTTTAPLYEVDGSAKERQALYEEAPTGFLLMGYEQLLRDSTHVQRYAPALVLLDEAQRIKNWARRSGARWGFARGEPRRPSGAARHLGQRSRALRPANAGWRHSSRSTT